MSAGQATAQAGSRDTKALRYVARQAIFDCELKVFGYELLSGLPGEPLRWRRRRGIASHARSISGDGLGRVV
jgi:hypothetical protein